MINKSIKNSVIIINHFFQVSILLGLVYLQSLTKSKALVMRHLYQRNLDFKSHFLSDTGLIIQSLIVILLMISAAFYLKKLIELDRSYFKRIETALFIVISLLILFVINIDFFKNLLVYGYLILGFYLILIIQSTNIRIAEEDWKDQS